MIRRSWLLIGTITLAILMLTNGSAQTWSNQPMAPYADAPSFVLRDSKSAGSGISVLFVVADNPAAYARIRNGLAALPEIGTIGTFNSSSGTPTLEQLLDYMVVIVWANMAHNNPNALGNVLADYVDSGGAVIASTPSRIPPAFFLGGRFATDGYDPLTNGFGPLIGRTSLGGQIDHPAMTTPYMITKLIGDFRERADLRPDAERIAWWADNNTLLAINGTVAGDTAFLHDTFWDGQFPELLANLCVFLTGGSESF